MVDTPQGNQLTEALRMLADIVVDQRLLHDGNPVLGWMGDNLVVRFGDGGVMRPDKDKSADKIDGQVALVMALDIIKRLEKAPELTADNLVMVL